LRAFQSALKAVEHVGSLPGPEFSVKVVVTTAAVFVVEKVALLRGSRFPAVRFRGTSVPGFDFVASD